VAVYEAGEGRTETHRQRQKSRIDGPERAGIEATSPPDSIRSWEAMEFSCLQSSD
jgi:hypothetical protein